MNVFRDDMTLETVLKIHPSEIAMIEGYIAKEMANIFARRFVDENYDKLLNTPEFREAVSSEAVRIAGERIATHLTEAFTKMTGRKSVLEDTKGDTR